MNTDLINSYKRSALPTSLYLICLASVLMSALLQQALANESGQTLTIQNSHVSVEIESVDESQAEQEKLKTLIENTPPAYQDKVMSAPELLELTNTEAEEIPEGFQSYFVETRANYTNSKTNTSHNSDLRKTGDWGLSFEYLYETASLGDLKIQAQASQQANNKQQNNLSFEEDDTATRATLSNNNLYLTPSIAADSTLGDTASELTDALRRSSRFSLGVDTLRGVRTRIRNKNFDIRLGSGQLAQLEGNPYAGYQTAEGHLTWIGASHTLGENFVIGVQANQVEGSESFAEQTDIQSLAAAINYKNKDQAAQRLSLMVLNSQKQGAASALTAQGLQLEGGFQLGRYTHELGIYQTDPNLYFGENALPSDQQGIYWRLQHQGTSLSWGGGLQLEKYNRQQTQSAASHQKLNVDANFQHRLSRNHSYGGNLRLEQTRYDIAEENDRRSMYGYFYYQLLNADWGRSRVSVTLRRNEKIVSNDLAATGEELQWEQSWLANTNQVFNTQPELVTSLGFAQDRSHGEQQTYPTAAVSGRYWFNPDWSLNSNLRYSSRTGGLSTSQGLAGSVASEYSLNSSLRLGASLNLNQAKVEVDSNGLQEAQTLRSHDKSGQVYLRWEGSRGREHTVLGKRTEGLAGTGNVVGYVFLDNNQDGERQADETGVPNVEVYLDGGFSVKTNEYGYFEFTRVATGNHQLTLNLDTVPLPWNVKQESNRVEVALRGQASANLALTKGVD